MKKSTIAGGAVIATEGVRSGIQVTKLLSRLGVELSRSIPAAAHVAGYAASRIALPVYAGVKVVQGGHYLLKNRKRIKSEGLGSVVKHDMGRGFREHPFKTIFNIFV
ncbi:MAG: hypothetical protein LBD71_00010 [Treponema sp.]|jgi:hypothetical protein|nr:hypothetical protein [Treponema sp.]